MSFFKRLFERSRAKKAAGEVIKELDSKKPEDVFENLTPPMAGAGSTQEEMSVTGQYAIVTKHMMEAVEEKKKVRSAARRLMDAIGVGPDQAAKK